MLHLRIKRESGAGKRRFDAVEMTLW